MIINETQDRSVLDRGRYKETLDLPYKAAIESGLFSPEKIQQAIDRTEASLKSQVYDTHSCKQDSVKLLAKSTAQTLSRLFDTRNELRNEICRAECPPSRKDSP